MGQEQLDYETPAGAQANWTKHEVASLALKLFGIYALLQALPLLAYLPAIVTLSPDYMSLIVFGSVHVLWGVVAGVLLLLSDRLAGLMLSRPQGEGVMAPPGQELQAMAFSVVGVVLIVWGIPNLGRFLAMLMFSTPYGRYPGEFDPPDWGLLAMAATQIVLGAVVFLRARGLALYWHKLRTAGT